MCINFVELVDVRRHRKKNENNYSRQRSQIRPDTKAKIERDEQVLLLFLFFVFLHSLMSNDISMDELVCLILSSNRECTIK